MITLRQYVPCVDAVHLHSCLSIPADSKPGLWDDNGRTSTNGIVATTKLVCNRANELKQTANNVEVRDLGWLRACGLWPGCGWFL